MFEGFWQGRNPSGTSRLFGTACKPCVIFSFLFFLFFLFLLFFSLQCIPLSWRVLGWLFCRFRPVRWDFRCRIGHECFACRLRSCRLVETVDGYVCRR